MEERKGEALRDSEAERRELGALLAARRGSPQRSQIQEGPSVGPKSMKPTTQGPLARLLMCVYTTVDRGCVRKCVPISAEPKYAGIQVSACLYGLTHSSRGLIEPCCWSY